MSSKIVKNDTETIQEQQTNLENMETEVTLNENLMTAENREIIIDEKCNYETSEEILVSGSLGDIQGYKSDSSSDSDSEDDSEDSEESSDSESESTDSSSEDLIEISNIPKKKPIEEESWLSVIGVDKASTDLPDISSLDLDDRDEFIHMGFVENIIEKIVTVAGLSQMPSYDLDTLLFLDDKKVLGYVLDVMGPVTAPVYIIPLNSEEGIEDMKLLKGAKVYCVPKSKYTKYVHLEELMKMRGSDASWMGDAEVPPEFQEFSDDEQERMTKKEKKRKRNQEQNSETVPNMDRLPGAHTKEPNRTRQQPQHARQRNTYQAEGSPNRPQFRNNPQNVMISGPPQQNQSVLNPVAAFNTPLMMPPPVIMPPAFNPSIPPPNFGAPRFFAPPIGNIFNQYAGPHNFSPRGVNFNRNPNGSNPRQNMPGPYNGSWFN